MSASAWHQTQRNNFQGWLSDSSRGTESQISKFMYIWLMTPLCSWRQGTVSRCEAAPTLLLHNQAVCAKCRLQSIGFPPTVLLLNGLLVESWSVSMSLRPGCHWCGNPLSLVHTGANDQSGTVMNRCSCTLKLSCMTKQLFLLKAFVFHHIWKWLALMNNYSLK